jgi:hypothetical protein
MGRATEVKFMKRCSLYGTMVVALLSLTLGASARDVVLPAGTLLQCTLNEPNFSSASVDVGDPVLCHLHGVSEFGRQAFPRGSYLVGHLEASKEPGHFFGKGYLKLQFDRIGLPSGDLPLEAKVIATRGYRVDREGKIDGKGHAKRDIVEWLLPPLWPWKVIMLPARGPRPKLKGESTLSLRLMDDVQIPQVATTYGPEWRFFGKPESQLYHDSAFSNGGPTLAVRSLATEEQTAVGVPHASYASLVSREVAAPLRLSTAPGMPVFFLKTGTILAVGNYTYQDGRISYSLASGGTGVIRSDQVDWSTTTRFNAERGVRVTLGSGRPKSDEPGL